MRRTLSHLQEFGGFPALLGRIAAGKDLTRNQAHAAMADILSDQATSAQIAGLIMGLRIKGESVEEMIGLVSAMFEASRPLTAPDGATDIVGTGGSAHRRKHALNVSTMACFVAAAAGVTICKHGNLQASSTSGSFDFLATQGIPADVEPAILERAMNEVGIGFVFARSYHPAMRFAGPVRAELGIPTVFNVLGPLANPARVRNQVVGVAEVAQAEKMARVLQATGSQRSWVVVGEGGLDELTSFGRSTVFEVTPDGIDRFELNPEDHGLTATAQLDDIVGGDAATNASIFAAILDGAERGPRYEMVVLNAAAAMMVAGVVDSLGEGLDRGRSVINDGAVQPVIAQLVAVTQL